MIVGELTAGVRILLEKRTVKTSYFGRSVILEKYTEVPILQNHLEKYVLWAIRKAQKKVYHCSHYKLNLGFQIKLSLFVSTVDNKMLLLRASQKETLD
jgi:hypothetical protein